MKIINLLLLIGLFALLGCDKTKPPTAPPQPGSYVSVTQNSRYTIYDSLTLHATDSARIYSIKRATLFYIFNSNTNKRVATFRQRWKGQWNDQAGMITEHKGKQVIVPGKDTLVIFFIGVPYYRTRQR